LSFINISGTLSFINISGTFIFYLQINISGTLSFFKSRLCRATDHGAAQLPAAPQTLAPHACRATRGGAAPLPRQALLPCLPCHWRWRRTPAAPHAMAPHAWS
jgi:hypothetical protein